MTLANFDQKTMSTPTKTPGLPQGIITPSCDITPTRETAREDAAYDDFALTQNDCSCPVPLTVRGTQALVSFAPLAFKLFYAARHNAVLRRSSFPSP